MSKIGACTGHTLSSQEKLTLCSGVCSGGQPISLRTKIDGAIARRRKLGASHCRHTEHLATLKCVVSVVCFKLRYVSTNCGRRNQYDGQEEFWVVARETGKRQESQSYEETLTQQKEAFQFVLPVVNSLQKFHQVSYVTFSICWSWQAPQNPDFSMPGGEKFQGLDGFSARFKSEQSAGLPTSAPDKFAQVGGFKCMMFTIVHRLAKQFLTNQPLR